MPLIHVERLEGVVGRYVDILYTLNKMEGLIILHYLRILKFGAISVSFIYTFQSFFNI